MSETDRLTELAKAYPEVKELLKDNYSLSVMLLRTQIKEFDREHTKAHAEVMGRVRAMEVRLDEAAEVVRLIRRDIKSIKEQMGMVFRE